MDLREYLVFAVILSAVMGVIGALSHGVLEAECESAIGVICLGLLAAPIAGIIGSGGGISGLPEFVPVSTEGGYTEVSEEAFVRGVESYLCAEYSLNEQEVEITSHGYSFSEARARELTLRLSGASALADVRSIKLKVKESFLLDGGECRVVMDIG